MRWTGMALQEIENALSSGQAPFIVGGTGFFIKALVEGLSPVPEVPAEIRQQGEEKIARNGLEALYQELYEFNPDHALRFDRHNPRRVLRAWEVWTATGQTLQSWQDMPRDKPPAHLQFSLMPVTRSKDELSERINRRFDIMLEHGALDEVQALTERINAGDVPADALVTKAHGFRPLRAYLKGETTLEEAKTHSCLETRQYAKRQMTWLRGQFDAFMTPRNAPEQP
jgi:tRNA dimethylallyltransferase